jgi:hypothetical protein
VTLFLADEQHQQGHGQHQQGKNARTAPAPLRALHDSRHQGEQHQDEQAGTCGIKLQALANIGQVARNQGAAQQDQAGQGCGTRKWYAS